MIAGVTGTSPLRYDGRAEPGPKSAFSFSNFSARSVAVLPAPRYKKKNHRNGKLFK